MFDSLLEICGFELVFYPCGSQLGFQRYLDLRTAGTISIARLMESAALSEEELFMSRPEEIPRIGNGTVTLIPVEDKQRVLDLLQEVLRFRMDLGYLAPIFEVMPI